MAYLTHFFLLFLKQKVIESYLKTLIFFQDYGVRWPTTCERTRSTRPQKASRRSSKDSEKRSSCARRPTRDTRPSAFKSRARIGSTWGRWLTACRNNLSLYTIYSINVYLFILFEFPIFICIKKWLNSFILYINFNYCSCRFYCDFNFLLCPRDKKWTLRGDD